MKYNKDLEFLNNRFENENVTAPESLSEDSVMAMLDGDGEKNIVKFENKMSKAAKRALATVAVFAFVIGSLGTSYAFVTRIHEPVAISEGVVQYKTYKDIGNRINKMNSPRVNGNSVFGILAKDSYTAIEETASNETAESYGKADGALSGEVSHAETNLQVENVDEADIIKNDGRYIYYLSGYRNMLTIYKTDNGASEAVSKTEIDDSIFPQEMFVADDRLIVINVKYEDNTDVYTTVSVYDITDRSAPEPVGEYTQSGGYTSSRMIGNVVYLISSYYTYDYNVLNNDDCIPRCGSGDEETIEKIPVEDIYEVEKNNTPSFAVVGAFDVSSDDSNSSSKAVLGMSSEVYCNENNLYLTSTENDGSRAYTHIMKYTFDGTDIELTASAKIEGVVDSQFSLDEKDGNLRIATTSYDYGFNYMMSNNLFVLNESLEEIGKVTGFAKEESIKAVRFIGDTAYVITFVQTDPLFVIDLGDPENPKITGEVKIDGFSTSLTPVDENTLLGIGYNTADNEFGGVYTDGLKIVLFDISDKSNPKVLDEKVFESYNSAAQYNHKAIVRNAEQGYFAIPVSTGYYEIDYAADFDGYYNAQERDMTGAIIIKTDGASLNAYGVESSKPSIERVTYTGDFLYMLSDDGIASAQIQ